MIQLRIDNSTCRVSGLTEKQFKELREQLSYTPKANQSYFSGKAYGMSRHLLDKRGEFPTGLLYLVDRYLKGLKVERIDARKRPESLPGLFSLKLPYEPYPEQKRAAEACGRFKRGIVVAPTALGKSAIAALIVHTLQVRTLIVVPSLELRRQLTESLREAFGAGMVGRLGSPLAVENVDALDPKKVIDYDCVIVDEFHHSGAKTYRALNKKAWSKVYYKFGLTATPFRSNEDERLLLESVLSQVICRIKYEEAVANKRVAPVEAYYYDLPVQEVQGNENSWPSMYSELIVNNDYRNRLIAHLMKTLKESGVPTLCLVKEIQHGEILGDLTGAMFANGKEDLCREMIQLFNLQKVTDLIGTTGVIGEGVDTKPAQFVIPACGGKSKNAFMQWIGRVMRMFPGKESGKVILFRDASHKWMLQHFNAQVKILREEYGIKPVKLPLPEGL
jgi:superfamily II DNA or RNA helicase